MYRWRIWPCKKVTSPTTTWPVGVVKPMLHRQQLPCPFVCLWDSPSSQKTDFSAGCGEDNDGDGFAVVHSTVRSPDSTPWHQCDEIVPLQNVSTAFVQRKIASEGKSSNSGCVDSVTSRTTGHCCLSGLRTSKSSRDHPRALFWKRDPKFIPRHHEERKNFQASLFWVGQTDPSCREDKWK